MIISNSQNKYLVNKTFQKELYQTNESTQVIIDSLKTRPAIMEEIKAKAVLMDKTVPHQLLIEAQNKQKRKLLIKNRYNHLIHRIANDSIWMIDIKKGAKEKGITEKQMISRAAKYIIKEETRNGQYK